MGPADGHRLDQLHGRYLWGDILVEVWPDGGGKEHAEKSGGVFQQGATGSTNNHGPMILACMATWSLALENSMTVMTGPELYIDGNQRSGNRISSFLVYFELNDIETRPAKLADSAPSFSSTAEYGKINLKHQTTGQRCMFPVIMAEKTKE